MIPAVISQLCCGLWRRSLWDACKTEPRSPPGLDSCMAGQRPGVQTQVRESGGLTGVTGVKQQDSQDQSQRETAWRDRQLCSQEHRTTLTDV
jgi:hypothetical protein